jgi:hypothetical protein
MDMIKLLDDAEKAIATLMLEVNRLNDELDAFKLNYYNTGYSLQLRDKDETIKQQQAEIEALKKELALQRLSDIGQAIEKPVGSNWWKGDPTCGGIAENYMSKKDEK